MKKTPLRIIAGFLLVIALLMLSGVASTAAAFVDSQTVSSCCASDCEKAPERSGTCSTPDCPCFYCIIMAMAVPLKVQRDSQPQAISYPATQHSHYFQYSPAIEYPPEAA